MRTRPKPCAVVFAKDIVRLARFYRDVAELTEIHVDSDHVILDDEDFQIVIHGIPKMIADTIEIAEPPEMRDDAAIKICFPVSSIRRARVIAKELGGQISPKAKEWQSRGFRACDGFDPEGNVFQLRETAD